MTRESARQLRDAEQDPQDPDEIWEAVQDLNEEVDWDLYKLVPELAEDDNGS